MAIVFRLETEEGFGVFNGRSQAMYELSKVDFHLYAHANEHPGPYSDYPIKRVWKEMPFIMQNDYRFGFSSVAQMLDWFPRRALRILRKHGIRISCYEVADHHMVVGDAQVVFHLPTARRLETKHERRQRQRQSDKAIGAGQSFEWPPVDERVGAGTGDRPPRPGAQECDETSGAYSRPRLSFGFGLAPLAEPYFLRKPPEERDTISFTVEYDFPDLYSQLVLDYSGAGVEGVDLRLSKEEGGSGCRSH